jgi:hypothetical protein
MLQERLEGSLSEVGGVDETAACSGEYEALLLVERSRCKHLLRLLRPVAIEGLYCLRSDAYGAAALLGLWLARDKDAPCAGEGTAVHGARCALNVQLGLAAPY